ncbi:MAG: hypothetical protein WA824_16680 [Candidatus Sulfotelmatobacter sp.]
MIRNIRTFIAMALPIVAFALASSPAMAQSYTGNWPATVSQSHRANGTYCITLTDDGSLGWPHSGEATLVPAQGTDFGTFQVIDGVLMVTFTQPGGTAENGALLFIASASDGRIGKGAYEQFYGTEIDSGVLVFGAKGGCSGNQ